MCVSMDKFFFLRERNVTYIKKESTVHSLLAERPLSNIRITTKSSPPLFIVFLSRASRRCLTRTRATRLILNQPTSPVKISEWTPNIGKLQEILDERTAVVDSPDSACFHHPRAPGHHPKASEQNTSSNAKEEEPDSCTTHRSDAGTGVHADEGERDLEYLIPQSRRRLPRRIVGGNP